MINEQKAIWFEQPRLCVLALIQPQKEIIMLNNYCKHTRKEAFRQARACLQYAREAKPIYGFDYSKSDWLELVKFWRNDAAYYIRRPA